MDIGNFEFAPTWLRVFSQKKGITNIDAYAWFRKFPEDISFQMHPNLRDRTQEMEAALTGMSKKEQRIFVVKGSDLMLCGMEIAGAQIVQKFVIILA